MAPAGRESLLDRRCRWVVTESACVLRTTVPQIRLRSTVRASGGEDPMEPENPWPVVLLPGGILPAQPAYAALLAELGDAVDARRTAITSTRRTAWSRRGSQPPFASSGPIQGATGRTQEVSGSGGRIRTYDHAVNSRPLYH